MHDRFSLDTLGRVTARVFDQNDCEQVVRRFGRELQHIALNLFALPE